MSYTFSSSASSWGRNILFLLLAIQILPATIKVVRNYFNELASTATSTKVGVVNLSGEIHNTLSFIRQCQSLLKYTNVAALVITIDSAGGAPGGSQAAHHGLLDLKKEFPGKPIVAYVQNTCASGAYYIAAATDFIMATPSALFGSIGVYMHQMQFHKLLKQYNIEYTVIKSGKYKAAGDKFTEMTPEQQAMFQDVLKNVYERFTQDIKKAREAQLKNIPESEWAEGRPMTAEMGLQRGLVDMIGSHIALEGEVRRLAHITTAEINWVRAPQRSMLHKLLHYIIGNDPDADEEYPFLSAFVNTLCTRLRVLTASHAPTLTLS